VLLSHLFRSSSLALSVVFALIGSYGTNALTVITVHALG
jgi:hypothetical protein